jgi:hypothetical protein
MYDWLKNDSYVIENDIYVRIRWLRLILYDWFFSCRTVIFKGRMSSIRVLWNCKMVLFITGEWKFPECLGLPRVPNMGHSRKKCTRGTNSPWHSRKTPLPRVHFFSTRGSQPLPRVSHPSTLGSKPLPRVPHPSTRGRVSSPSAWLRHSGKSFFCFLFFASFF